MSVLQHGQDVRSWYQDMRAFLVDGQPLKKDWGTMPAWISDPIVAHDISVADDEVMGLYQVYHDCGKPRCLTVDDAGRRHFPDHAAVSKRAWLEAGGREDVAELIGMNMDAHLLKADGVHEFASRPQAIPLLITAICEVRSNAEMFGGTRSEGYKIKMNRLWKTGLRVLQAIVAQRQSRDL